MMPNAEGTRLFVANSNADSVSVIDTAIDQEVERIDVRLAEDALPGASPEGLALSDDDQTLYVANAHSNAVAVVLLSDKVRGRKKSGQNGQRRKIEVLGFIRRPVSSAVAFADGKLFIGNGKGTGFEPSSMRVNNSGRTPNPPKHRVSSNKEKNSRAGNTAGRLFRETSAWFRCRTARRWRTTHSRPCRTTGLSILRRPNFLRERSHQTRHLRHQGKSHLRSGLWRCENIRRRHSADGEPGLAIFRCRRHSATP